MLGRLDARWRERKRGAAMRERERERKREIEGGRKKENGWG